MAPPTVQSPTANSQSVNVGFDAATLVTVTGHDPNTPSQSLTFAITALPAHGSLSGAAPSVATPDDGYTGPDSFAFTVTNTSNLTSTPATVAVTVAAATHTFASGLTLISVPTDYSGQSIASVLGYASPMLAVWDPAALTYDLTPTPPADTLTAGQGYWARFPASASIGTLGTAPPNPCTLALTPGWNMIGCPASGPVEVGSVNIVDSANNVHTFSEAVSTGLILGNLFTWQPGDTKYEVVESTTGSLTPYEGYWLYAIEPCTISYSAP